MSRVSATVRNTVAAAVATGLCMAPVAAAQEISLEDLVDRMSLDDLANMVVTDTKVAQSLDSVTQNITVLLGDDQSRYPNNTRNIAERLRYVSGQFVNVLSRNDANWGAYAGLGPKYNSYLLDGLPVDSFVDPMSLDPWAFERIEAHKGPASVLYGNYLTMDFAGNEAPLAGTTNLILRDRVDQARTRLQASYGSYDTTALRAYHQNRQGNLDYFVGGGTEKSRYDQYGKDDSFLQTVEDPDYRKTKLYGKASYAFGRDDHRLSLFGHHTRHDGDFGRPNRGFDHQYDLLNLVYNNRFNDTVHMQFKAGERRYRREFDNDNFPAGLDYTGSSITRQRIRPMDLTVNFSHWGNSLLTVGADYQTVDYSTRSHAKGPARVDNDVEGVSRGLYIQEKVQLGDWVLRGGVRRYSIEHEYRLLDRVVPEIAERDWGDNLWSIGLRYNISPTLALYANAGSSFMAPAAKQIGGTVANPDTDSGQLANPALDAESGVGQDLGVQWQPTAELHLGLRLFRNTVSSAIVDSAVRAIPSQARAVNAGKLEAKGVELDIRHSPAEHFSWFANATFSDASADQPDAQLGENNPDGAEIPFVPDLVANIGLWWSGASDARVSAYYQWVGEYYDGNSRASRARLGHYGVLNLRADRPLWRGEGSALRLFVELNNIGDQRFDLPFGFRDPGFNGIVGVDLTF